MGMSENLSRVVGLCIRGAFVAVLLVAACNAPDAQRDTSLSKAKSNATIISPSAVALGNVKTVPLRGPRNLVENSAAVMSRRQAGVWFTVNDSGNEPLLFALDTLGANRGVWRVLDAANVDWEAASIGACGTTGAGAAASCIYIGDVGDNNGRHPSGELYRVVEPDAIETRDAGNVGAIKAELLRFRYADRPHDVEAMYVAPNGDVVLITKRELRDRAGQLRPALVFRISALAWEQRQPVVAALVDSLPIVPSSVPFRLITDASLAQDAKHLAVRTYGEVYVFATDSLTGAVRHDVKPTVCDVTALSEYQGEGVAFVAPSGRLLFTSEGRRSPLHLGDCVLP